MRLYHLDELRLFHAVGPGGRALALLLLSGSLVGADGPRRQAMLCSARLFPTFRGEQILQIDVF